MAVMRSRSEAQQGPYDELKVAVFILCVCVRFEFSTIAVVPWTSPGPWEGKRKSAQLRQL